jgi:hypothetical protein
MEILEQVAGSWDSGPDSVEALESGKIVFLPALRFELSHTEERFLSPRFLRGHSKNISFRPASGDLGVVQCSPEEQSALAAMLGQFYTQASSLVWALLPRYREVIAPGFTSFRPAEISTRTTSWRKDDTRLHVDAFPSRPLEGRRILRVFSNVNPSVPRIWRAGEAFEIVAERFLPRVQRPFPGSSWLLHRMRLTKTRRTAYDHFMIGIHDAMKSDQRYQQDSPQVNIAMPPGSTWLCFTDSVPHAAMSGQFALEQTFYVPVEAMRDPAKSPLRVLERLAGRQLV